MITSGASGSLAFDFDDADASINAKSIPDERFNFMLSKAESNLESEFALRFDEHGNTEIDPYDGYYLGTYASSFANLYTLIGDQGLSINNLPLNFAGEKSTHCICTAQKPVNLHLPGIRKHYQSRCTLRW